MKPLLFFLALLMTANVYAQNFCLRLSEVSNDGSTYVVRIEIQGDVAFDLGSSNLQWSYNSNALSNPELASSPLAPPFYQIPTVTTQGGGEVSFNIELGFVGFGTTVSAMPAWTEMGTVSFTITDPGNVGFMEWSYNGGTTQTVVFLDDEATQIFAADPTCLIGTSSPVPVELLSFAANQRDQMVKLDWETAGEIDNEGFEVLRSKDAEEWEKIAWIPGQGQSQLRQAYQAWDEKPWQGSNYYRLKQVDINGAVSYSPIRTIYFQDGNALILFPNPADKETVIQHPAEEELADVIIYDQMGQEIRRFKPRSNVLEVGDLSGGVYFVEIWMTNERRYYQKLLIQKR